MKPPARKTMYFFNIASLLIALTLHSISVIHCEKRYDCFELVMILADAYVCHSVFLFQLPGRLLNCRIVFPADTICSFCCVCSVCK